MNKAYLLISSEVGKEHDLCLTLNEIDEIKNVLITFGIYDLVAEIDTETEDKMNNLISSKIRKLENIRSTVTLRAIN